MFRSVKNISLHTQNFLKNLPKSIPIAGAFNDFGSIISFDIKTFLEYYLHYYLYYLFYLNIKNFDKLFINKLIFNKYYRLLDIKQVI